MSDTWVKDGVIYTIDVTIASGGIITAQRESGLRMYSRVVPASVNREEVEKLFAADFMK